MGWNKIFQGTWVRFVVERSDTVEMLEVPECPIDVTGFVVTRDPSQNHRPCHRRPRTVALEHNSISPHTTSTCIGQLPMPLR
jgi:hypothetical protein